MRYLHVLVALLLLTVASAAPRAQQARTTITSADVIDMVKAGLSPAVITQSIKTAGWVIFDVSPRGLIDLKNAGVPDDVMKEMIARQGAPAGGTAPASRRSTPASRSPEPQTVTGEAAPAPAGPTRVAVPDATTVRLKVAGAVSSATAKEGDPLRFTAVEDVRVGEMIVIRKGAPAEGRLTEVKKAGRLSKGGSLNFAITTVTAADSSPVRLRFNRDIAGQGGAAKAVTSMAVDAATAGGKRAASSAAKELLTKGREAVISANTEYVVFTDGAHEVTGTPAQTSGSRRR